MGHVPRVGAIFTVPIDEDRHGVGQVAGDRPGELYLPIRDVVADPGRVDLAIVEGAPPSLGAGTFAGGSPIVGNRIDVLEARPQPTFEAEEAGGTCLEGRDLETSRPATDRERKVLRYRTMLAPIRPQRALGAHHGIGGLGRGLRRARGDPRDRVRPAGIERDRSSRSPRGRPRPERPPFGPAAPPVRPRPAIVPGAPDAESRRGPRSPMNAATRRVER